MKSSLRSSKLVFLLSILLVLAGCASVPLASMWKMCNLDTLQMDPEQVRLVVNTDKIVKFEDGSTTIKLSFKADEMSEFSFEKTL